MEDDGGKSSLTPKKKKAREHMDQIQRLQQKDPEFYEFLKEHDKELLEFNDEGIDEDDDMEYTEEDEETDGGDLEDVDDREAMEEHEETDEGGFEDVDDTQKDKSSSKEIITSEMVDSWCKSIQDNTSLGAVRSLLRAYRAACHYGDDVMNGSDDKLSTMSSDVFNKIMQFVLSEMDRILREIFKLPRSGGNRDSVINLKNTREWKKYNSLVKSYLGNSLHVLNQMTDTKMISYTLRKLRHSSVFLVAFPAVLRKYVKVILHFWATGGAALAFFSFMFLRDLCMHLDSECFDDCFKGMYKAYILNCQYVNAAKLQHIQFLGNCLVELVQIDLAAAYQHAFIFIRQLAMILREAISSNKKELFRKVYGWKFMKCLEVWTGVICAYCSVSDLKALAYPLTQIITGAARLVPSAQYFPLRLGCIRMLNRIACSTGTFIPVSFPLLDMLEMKELHRPPTGGAGKAVDFRTMLKVKKSELKTRAFQEACVFSVIEELTEHLVQWSYSVAFFELSFIPAVRLRNFCKSTKVERFRREMRQLIRQIEANCEFTNKERASISFRPNDLEATSCIEEKKSGSSPLSKYAAILRQRAQERNSMMMESTVLVGERASAFRSKLVNDDGDDDAENVEDSEVFNSSWLPGSDPRAALPKEEKREKKKGSQEKSAIDEDIVEDLVLSSDEEGSMSEGEDANPVESKPNPAAHKLHSKKGEQADLNPSAPKSRGKKGRSAESKPAAQKLHSKRGKPAGKLPAQSKKKLDSSASKSKKRKRRS